MPEKERVVPSGGSDMSDISIREAQQIILEAFESDPTLEIKTGQTYPSLDLLINYTNRSDYRGGDPSSICIYSIPPARLTDPEELRILISQVYPSREGRKDDLALRIFLHEDFPAIFYTSDPKNGYEFQKGVVTDCEIPSDEVAGGEKRVKGVLKDAEKFTKIFLLYDKFFRTKNSLGIPMGRLNIGRVQPFLIKDFSQSLRMLEEIKSKKRPIVHYHPNSEILQMYDHAGYIGHFLHM